jgi:hypothetical protein
MCAYLFDCHDKMIYISGGHRSSTLGCSCGTTKAWCVEYVRVNVDELAVEQLSVAEYLEFKEHLVNGRYLFTLNPQCIKIKMANAISADVVSNILEVP